MAEQVVTVSRVIHAPTSDIFAILADPTRHGDIDGSGMVQRARGESKRLELGSTFGMDMKIGPIPYRITNTVVEFEPDRLIAWRHLGRHRWRYVLEPVDAAGERGNGGDGSSGPATRVTESFDWSTAPAPSRWFIQAAGYPSKHPANMEATLERLAALVET